MDRLLKEANETLTQIVKTLESKNADYTGDRGEFHNFQLSESITGVPLDKGIMVRLGDKFARLVTLLDRGPKVKNESLFDTIDDAIGYLIILKAYKKYQINMEPANPVDEVYKEQRSRLKGL